MPYSSRIDTPLHCSYQKICISQLVVGWWHCAKIYWALSPRRPRALLRTRVMHPEGCFALRKRRHLRANESPFKSVNGHSLVINPSLRAISIASVKINTSLVTMREWGRGIIFGKKLNKTAGSSMLYTEPNYQLWMKTDFHWKNSVQQ